MTNKESKHIKDTCFWHCLSNPLARKITTIVSTIISLLSLWIADNCSYTISNETLIMKVLHFTSLVSHAQEPSIPENFLAVNIAYDKQLTPISDEFGIPQGMIDVTNRGSLLQFLQAIENSGYSAIVLDVAFDIRIPVNGDTALFAQINKMPRIVVPSHHDMKVSNLISPDKIALSDYSANPLETNFVKYPFHYSNGDVSIAERVGEYYGYRRSCFYNYNSLVLPLTITANSQYDNTGCQQWYNLGKELLNEDIYSRQELRQLVDSKIVVIGSFTGNDMHDTYIGTIAGPIIIINAINAYLHGATHPKLIAICLIILTLFIISYMLVYDLPNRVKIKRNDESKRGSKLPRLSAWWKKIKNRYSKLLTYLRHVLNFSILVIVLQLVLYYAFNQFHDTTLLLAYLSLYAFYCQKLNNKYPLT